ncbi:MAG: beta-phosphoglucomutase [Acidobacteriota bacterium]|nr:beta-phosphoglucomutase [Acidobacteriota bacterium]
MIRAILFDFNGVIIDDEPLQLAAYQEVLRAEGIALTEADYYSCLGMDDVAFVRAAFQRAGRETTVEQLADVIARKTARQRELIKDELPLFPGVVTFVKSCARQWPAGLVSMARRMEIDHVLERAGLTKFFSAIVSAEDVSACKPDPACNLRALELLNERLRANNQQTLAAGECLVVEDSPAGIESARSAGMRTLGVANTVTESQLRDAGADVVTRSLFDWTPDAVYHVFSKR